MEEVREELNEEVNKPEADSGDGTANNSEKVVYSQMSLDYVASQVKKAHKKGLIEGIVISLLIVVLAGIVYAGVSICRMIVDGTFYANAISTFGKSTILDKETVDKINSVYSVIDKNFIEEVDPEVVREGMYRGMMEALEDPYSVYYTEEEFAEMMEDSSGEFEGIGAYLSQDPDTKEITVVRPIKGSPAEEVGIIAGDVIVEVDGEDILGQDLNLVVSKVRGPAGSTVNVGVRRSGKDEVITFEITRAKVDSESVEYEMLDDNIGYIFITEFANATGRQFVEAYDDLEEQGMTSVIIDLRSNGGGYVDTSVEVANRLVREGNIVSIKDRHNIGYSYEDEGDDSYCNIPCVVLVDGNTASASEILTGALKDYGIATVMGTQTFGKGIVQDVLPLNDGSGLKITNSKYYTPDGNNIHGIGIEPDIIVEFDGEKYVEERIDNQLEAAKSYLKGEYKE